MSGNGIAVALGTLSALEDLMEDETFSVRESIHVDPKQFEIRKKYLLRSPTAQHLDAREISELPSVLQEVEVMAEIFKALAASSSDLLDHCTRIMNDVSSKLSKGLRKLPDDILSLIFKFVVHSEADGTIHALRLSQVCQRFRCLSHRDQTLWSTIYLRLYTTKASTRWLISRTGNDTDLHLAINCGKFFSNKKLIDFMSVCSPTASRWRTLLVDGYWEASVTLTDKMIYLMKTYFLILPRLEEMHLVSDHRNWRETNGINPGSPIWVSSTANFANVRPWEAPNLRILRCTGYIPPPSFPFPSITSITLSLWLLPTAVRKQFEEMVAFLNSQPRLSELILTLQSRHDCRGEDELVPDPIVFPSITSFQISVSKLYSDEQIDKAYDIVAPIANAFRMPKLENFSLSFEAALGIEFEDFEMLVPLFIPDPNHHPLLTSFTLTAAVTDPMKWETSDATLVDFNIPLDKLPHVSTLCVNTFGRLFFRRGVEDGQDVFTELKALRNLQLVSCKHMDAEALEDIVRSLKDVGAWDTLERIDIRDCEMLIYDWASDIVGEKILRFSES